MKTHAELLKATEDVTDPVLRKVLAAILNLHTMGEYQSSETFCDVCVSDTSGIVWWPCPTVGIVVDALTRMGAL